MKHFTIIALLSLCFSSPTGYLAVHADATPYFENGVLLVPTVNTEQETGKLQEVVIKLNDSGTISLVDFREGVENQYIEAVSHQVTDTFPVQVFVQITGTFSHGCPASGQINSRRIGNAFEIRAYLANNRWLLDPGSVACTAALEPFSIILPLDVYGLEAGEYTYTVNGSFAGAFTLESPNVLDQLN